MLSSIEVVGELPSEQAAWQMRSGSFCHLGLNGNRGSVVVVVLVLCVPDQTLRYDEIDSHQHRRGTDIITGGHVIWRQQ